MRVRPVMLLLVAVLLAAPASAADPLFPLGLRIGMVPPPGMVPSMRFPGFENADKSIAILMAEFPADAYGEVEKGLNPDVLVAQGFRVEAREPVELPQLTGTLIIGEQDAQGTTLRRWFLVARAGAMTALVSIEAQKAAVTEGTDATMRAALYSVTARAAVPSGELLSLLPYELKDLAGFRVVQAYANGGALLTEGEKDTVELAEQPAVIISIIPSVPQQGADRASFARMAMSGGTPGVKDMRIQRMDSMRIAGQQGFELLVEGKDVKTDVDLTLVQWLRFGMSSSLRTLAIARKDAWPAMFPRFRAIRDGLSLK
jgi:hypothetical protein